MKNIIDLIDKRLKKLKIKYNNHISEKGLFYNKDYIEQLKNESKFLKRLKKEIIEENKK